MRRADAAVLSISSVLAAVVIAAVAFSLTVLDRIPSSSAFGAGSDSSWLVLTWGPSLCRVESSNRGCTSGHVGQLGGTWILHGLWPQPEDNQYCDVPAGVADRARKIGGADAPTVNLSDSVQASLQSMMSDASVLAPHEWYAHGTCSGLDPDPYFADAVALTEQARSVLDPMFDGARGAQLSQSAVRAQFDAQFGSGAGDRIAMTCRNVTGEGSVVYEIHVSLPPVADLSAEGETPSLATLLTDSPAMGDNCRHGRVL